MLHNSKNCEIVEKCSIERTLLVELSWGKSREGGSRAER